MIDRQAVRVSKPIAKIVASANELRLAGRGTHFTGIGVPCDVMMCDLISLLRAGAGQLLGRFPGGKVQPTVDATAKPLERC